MLPCFVLIQPICLTNHALKARFLRFGVGADNTGTRYPSAEDLIKLNAKTILIYLPTQLL